jgi:hypothetical protein
LVFKQQFKIIYKKKTKKQIKKMATKKEPKYTPGMSGRDFFENQVDASDVFEIPFNMKLPTDLDRIKAMCELC